MKKIIYILLLAVLASGCDGCQKRKNIVIALDHSASITEEAQQDYLNVIKTDILPRCGEKDRLTIVFIDDCSQARSEAIYTLDMSEKDFSNAHDGLMYAEKNSQERMERYLRDTVLPEVDSAIQRKRLSRRDCNGYSDIINTLDKAQPLLLAKGNVSGKGDRAKNVITGDESYTYINTLFILSDMINDSRDSLYSFTRFGRLTDEGIEARLSQLQRANKVPDLNELDVIVHGATIENHQSKDAPILLDNIEHFWKAYFKSAKARLVHYGYDARIEIKNYLSKADR